ncbi:MAG TPA: hypothetical protein VKV15_11230 [Bryobacteraceae bacterium]|nr:hypothetical protein [Bryobacteraceae bacterium]
MLAACVMARLKKARREGRTIVFADESGVSQRPHRCRTWAIPGCTPGGPVPSGSGFSERVVGADRSFDDPGLGSIACAPPCLVRDYITGLHGQIHVEYLPVHAPELNPVEYIWAYWKQHELPPCLPEILLATW